MPWSSRIARLKAAAKARKDPLRRAVGAPSVKVPPVGCPLGQCEHVAMLHNPRWSHDALGGNVEGATCTACDCEGDL